MNNDLCNQAPLDVPLQFLKLRTVCVLAAVPFVCVFFAVTAFQFVFAKLNLAFYGNAVLFVCLLSCIDCVYSVVHIVAPFLKKETEPPILLYRQLPRKSTVALENLMPTSFGKPYARCSHSTVCRSTCGIPHRAVAPVPGVKFCLYLITFPLCAAVAALPLPTRPAGYNQPAFECSAIHFPAPSVFVLPLSLALASSVWFSSSRSFIVTLYFFNCRRSSPFVETTFSAWLGLPLSSFRHSAGKYCPE